MASDDDIVEVVDEIADDLNPPRIADEAARLGLSVDELLGRVIVEVKDRIGA